MANTKYEDRKKRVMLGNLPDDFLRVSSTSAQINSTNPVGASSAQVTAWNYTNGNTVGSVSVSIIQAQLNKNYGLTKMDPYVRLRIGHNVYETHSDIRGGKYPNWNKTFHSYLPPGVKSIHIEVFDEHSITSDERVAWTDFAFPDELFQGKFVDTWVPLSGKLGEEKEGSINITVFFTPVSLQPHPVTPGPIMMMQSGPVVSPMPYYIPGQPVAVQYPMAQRPMIAQTGYNPMHPPTPARYQPTEEDIKQLQEMFPSFDREVILGCLENGGSKDSAINMLLQLSENQ